MNFYLIILFFIAFRIKINIYKYLYIINLYIVCQSRESYLFEKKGLLYNVNFENLFLSMQYITFLSINDDLAFFMQKLQIKIVFIDQVWHTLYYHPLRFFFAHREINPYNDVFSIYSAIKMIDCFLYAHIGLSN